MHAQILVWFFDYQPEYLQNVSNQTQQHGRYARNMNQLMAG